MLDNQLITASIDRSKHTVLVVDDDPTTRYTTTRLLQSGGFKTVTAATGAEALSFVTTGISAVVLDVQLPDFSGFEICRRIRARKETATLPVMHLSAAYIRNEDHVLGLDSGADAYLVHPVEPTVLIATVQALVRARMAEDGLRKSEIRFRAIYNNAQSGIVLIDALGRFADVNPAMERMLGRTRDELLGRAISEFAPRLWFPTVQEMVLDNPQGPASWQGEFPLVDSAGRLVHLDWHMSSHVEPGLRIGIAQDVTERNLLDRRRQDLLEREQEARQVAEQHGRTKDDFISILSHELRTPLNTIMGWVTILKLRGAAPELAKGFEIIERNVKMQARIISDILDVSRINSGKLQLDCTLGDPEGLLEDCIASLRAAADAKQVVVRLETEPVGQAWLDCQRFEQICWNLLTNAIKFSRVGGVVTISLQRAGNALRLVVADEGQGVSPAFLDRMFERFTQGDTPGNRTHGGLGLGLSIVKHLTELHGGTVKAESEGLDKGTTMTVQLPIALPNTLPGELVTIDTDGGSGRAIESLRILIVEDDQDSRQMLALFLEEQGANVGTAEDFDSAILAIDQEWPDVLLCDIGLPGRDGYDIVRTVREIQAKQEKPQLQCIALTAFARQEDMTNALEAGFDLHIAKPLRPFDVLKAITR